MVAFMVPLLLAARGWLPIDVSFVALAAQNIAMVDVRGVLPAAPHSPAGDDGGVRRCRGARRAGFERVPKTGPGEVLVFGLG